MRRALAPLERMLAVHNAARTGFGRIHNNLRISVTDRCNIRCFYCMPENDVQFVPRRDPRFRGDRTIRPGRRRARGRQAAGDRGRAAAAPRPAGADRAAGRIPGIRDLALTTNGVLLHGLAGAAVRCGAAPDQRPPGHARPRAVPRNHAARRSRPGAGGNRDACRLGYRVKLNAVAVKKLVEPDIVPLARFARENGFEMRYIEFMPLDAQNLWDRGKVLLADDMIEMLSREIAPLDSGPGPRSARPAPSTTSPTASGAWDYRVGEPAVLPELQSFAPDGGRQTPLLPVRHRRGRREDADAVRRVGRGNRRS